jgi:hypothetical protein
MLPSDIMGIVALAARDCRKLLIRRVFSAIHLLPSR